MIVRNSTLTVGSTSVTALARTSDIMPAVKIYGTGVPVETLVSSIATPTSLVMSRPATLGGVKSLTYTNACPGIYQEMCDALQDARNIVAERGMIVQFVYRKEADVTRDEYNSIAKRSTTNTVYFLRCYPVQFAPNTKFLEKAGLREVADVVVYTAMKDWQDLGINFGDIRLDLRHTINIEGETYELKEKALVSQFSDTFLYVSFGANKR